MRVSSTNPKFSYIINKNPSSPMSIKSLKKGHLVGGYTKDGSYVSVFIDNEGPDSSFGADEYLNSGQYKDPTSILNILTEHYRSCINEKHEYDLPHCFSHEIDIPIFPMSAYDVEYLSSTFPVLNGDIGFHATAIEGTPFYKVKIVSKWSLYKTFHFLQAILFFSLLKSDIYMNQDMKGFLSKYMTSISIGGLPYRWITQIKVKVLTNQDRFKEWKDYLEKGYRVWTGKSNKVSLNKGDTLSIRKEWVSTVVPGNTHLVDVGCNVGNYLFLSKKVKSYHPIDINEEYRAKINKKVEDKNLDNVDPAYASIEDWFEVIGDRKCCYLLTEVLEHMSLEEAKQMLASIFTKGNCERVIITVPNYEFNTFYAGEGTDKPNFRHEDHQWEATPILIQDLLSFTELAKHCLVSLGDEIQTSDGKSYQPTYGLIIEK